MWALTQGTPALHWLSRIVLSQWGHGKGDQRSCDRTGVSGQGGVLADKMPLGRLYQAPTTVARNAPVFGYNGLKSVSNSDLVITGQAVRNKKSKSPSPALRAGIAKTSSSSVSSTAQAQKTSSTSPPRQNGTKKSPSPGIRTPKSVVASHRPGKKALGTAGKENKNDKENKKNNNLNDNEAVNDDVLEVNDLDNAKKEKSWSPENGERVQGSEGDDKHNDNEKASCSWLTEG